MAPVPDEQYWRAVKGVLTKGTCGECPVCTPEELAAYAEGRLRGRTGHILRAHLENCWKCYEIVLELQREINSERLGAGFSVGRREGGPVEARAVPAACLYPAACRPPRAVPAAAPQLRAHRRLRGPGWRWAAAAVPAALVLTVTLTVFHQTRMLGPFSAPMAGGRYAPPSAYRRVVEPRGPTTSEEQAPAIPPTEAPAAAGPPPPASGAAPGEAAPAPTRRDSGVGTVPPRARRAGPQPPFLAPPLGGQEAGGNHGNGGEGTPVENGGNGSSPIPPPPLTGGPSRPRDGDEEGVVGGARPYVSPEHSLARRWEEAGGDTSQFSLRELQELQRQYPEDKRILRALIAGLEKAVARGDLSMLPRLQRYRRALATLPE